VSESCAGRTIDLSPPGRGRNVRACAHIAGEGVTPVEMNPSRPRSPNLLPHRPRHRLRLPRNHREQHLRRLVRAMRALLPIPYRPKREVESGRKVLLRVANGLLVIIGKLPVDDKRGTGVPRL
jgi:hypothetical protein